MITRFNIDSLQDFFTDEYTILVPNQRIRDALLCSYAEYSSAECWLTPDINAIDIWLKNQWQSLASKGQSPFFGLKLLDSLEESLLWVDIVEQDQQDTALLNIEETAASAQQAYQLYRLWLDDGSDPQNTPSASGIAELKLFAKWCRLFSKHCQDQQLISLADATHLLIQEFSRGSIEFPDNIVALNFYQPPPLYLKLLQILMSDWDTHYIQTADQGSNPAVVCHTFPDSESEIRACIQWAEQLLTNQPNAHIAIIVADEHKSQFLTERLLRDTFNPVAFANLDADRALVNGISFNSAILEHKLISDAMLLLNLANPVQNSADFCHLLQSPNLLGYSEELEARIKLEHYIRENLGTRCNTSQLLQIMSREKNPYYCPILKQVLLELINQTRAQRAGLMPGEWVQLFSEQLKMLGWPALHPSHTKAHQALLTSWQKVIDCFSNHQPAAGRIIRSTALSRLRGLCQKTVVPLPFDPNKAISLYRLTDATGLEFSHTWFLGFSDQFQPEPPSPSPFLAHKLQRQAGIPGSHSEVQLQLAEAAFKIISHSTNGELHASYHLADGDENFRPSSLIEGFQDTVEPAGAHQPLNSLANSNFESLKLGLFNDEQAVELHNNERPGGGQLILSDQSRCPFRAFANHRLQSRELEHFTNGLSARNRGTAIHIALENLFSRITDSRQLNQLSAMQVHDLVSQCSEIATDYLSQRRPDLMTPRFEAIERQRIHRLLDDYLVLEKQRKDYQVLDTEKSLSWQRNSLQINLKIDRIDRLENQSLAIIDYKTGKYVPAVSRLTDERPDNLQLPLYFCAVSESLAETADSLVIAQISTGNVQFHGLAKEENFHLDVKSVSSRREFDSDWSALTTDWQTKIDDLANEFVHGVARVDPANGKKTCDTCKLQPLCRIRQIEPLQQYADGDEDYH